MAGQRYSHYSLGRVTMGRELVGQRYSRYSRYSLGRGDYGPGGGGAAPKRPGHVGLVAGWPTQGCSLGGSHSGSLLLLLLLLLSLLEGGAIFCFCF